MAATLKELIDKRTEAYGQIRKRADEFNAAGKKFKDGADQQAWDEANKGYDTIVAEIQDLQKAEAQADAISARMAKLAEQQSAPLNHRLIGLDDAGNGQVGGRRAPGNDGGELNLERDRELALDGWFRRQFDAPISRDARAAAKRIHFPMNSHVLRIQVPSTEACQEVQAAFATARANKQSPRHFAREYNSSLSSMIDSTGRTVIAPETLLKSLEINMLAYGAVRQTAEQLVTATGEPLAWPTFDDTANEGREIGEGAPADDNAGTGTSGDFGPNPSFGKTVWSAYKYTSDALGVPYELLEDAFVNLVPIIGDALGMRLGRITNRRFTTGTGAMQPQGIVTGSVLGVTAASASVITGDEVIDLEHSVDAALRDGTGYMLHDLLLAHLRKLKDGQGRYLWQASFNSGARHAQQPALLPQQPHGHDRGFSEVLLFGDLSKYKVRRVNQIRIYRLEERYREKDKDGFVAFVREDGGILNAGTAPIKHLIMHA